MTQTTLLQYEAPWPVHALDWCKAPAAAPRSSFRLGLASFTGDFHNRVAVVGLADERVLVEDDYVPPAGGAPERQQDFGLLCEAPHGYPATGLQWQPGGAAWGKELLATTGDALRVWEYTGEGSAGGAIATTGFVGRGPAAAAGAGHRLTLKTALSGQSKVQSSSTGAPLTNFSWNEKSPSLVVTSSIDTTCTVWNIETSTAITQLIAHDREVYDVAWLPGSTDIFVSVGADGSLRAFDLRSLEHSTILYETPAPKSAPPAASAGSAGAAASRPPTSPLLRIAFNPADSNYMSTFHLDGADVQILDMRSPGQPVMELRGHRAQVNALGWGSSETPLLATAGDDCQLLLWDLSSYTQTNGSPRGSSRLNSPRPDVKKRIVTDPVMAYAGQTEMTNLAWSPPIGGMALGGGHATAPGEWVAVAVGKTVRALKV